MSKQLHPSIGNTRAWFVLLLLSVCFATPAFLILLVTLVWTNFNGLFLTLAIAVCLFGAVPLYLFKKLVLETSTVGRALLFGTLMIVYAVFSSGFVQAWESQLKTDKTLGFISAGLLSDMSFIIGNLQTLLSLFSAAVGGGLVAACIFNSRVAPRAPDTKTGIPN